MLSTLSVSVCRPVCLCLSEVTLCGRQNSVTNSSLPDCLPASPAVSVCPPLSVCIIPNYGHYRISVLLPVVRCGEWKTRNRPTPHPPPPTSSTHRTGCSWCADVCGQGVNSSLPTATLSRKFQRRASFSVRCFFCSFSRPLDV